MHRFVIVWGLRLLILLKLIRRTIAPVENKLISIVTGGEGWHNYHHVFPWDYKAAEIGHPRVDLSTVFIETFSKIGWAYDLKEPSPDLVKSIVAKKGDGTYVDVTKPTEKNSHWKV